jgi:hypothetical protein
MAQDRTSKLEKKALAQTIAERISCEPNIRLRYVCPPHNQDSSLYPSIAPLERAVRCVGENGSNRTQPGQIAGAKHSRVASRMPTMNVP